MPQSQYVSRRLYVPLASPLSISPFPSLVLRWIFAVVLAWPGPAQSPGRAETRLGHSSLSSGSGLTWMTWLSVALSCTAPIPPMRRRDYYELLNLFPTMRMPRGTTETLLHIPIHSVSIHLNPSHPPAHPPTPSTPSSPRTATRICIQKPTISSPIISLPKASYRENHFSTIAIPLWPQLEPSTQAPPTMRLSNKQCLINGFWVGALQGANLAAGVLIFGCSAAP